MADSLEGPEKPKMRKLPPLSPRGQAENGVKKVVKKKKKQATETEQPNEEAQENNEPKPAKSKRRARSQSKSREDNEDVSVSKTDESSAPRKKKRKAKSVEGEDTVADKSAAETGEDVTGSKASLITGEEKPTKKKGKKKKVKKGISKDEFGDTMLAADLTYLADDVVTEGQKENEDNSTHFKSTNILRSQPTEKLYVETNSGFKGQDKTKLAKKWAEEEETKVVDFAEPATKTTMEFGLQTHKVLKTFCLFLHGLLAGIALWHIVVVYVLSYHSYQDFLLHYRPLSLPVQCMYYILLALCTVSACDRCDIGNTSGNFFRKAFSLQNTAVAILIYFFALFLSLSIVATEDKINLFDTLPELWQEKKEAEAELELWKTLNTVRGVVIILGWVVLSIAPNADRLGDNLQEGDDDEMLGKDLELAGVTPA